MGASTEEVTMNLLAAMGADDMDNLTLLAGEDFPQDAFDALVEQIEDAYPELEIEAQRGEQPLYPIILSLE